ncbi:MAG: hypothetical protein WA985_08270 [Erythrobacter sp.]
MANWYKIPFTMRVTEHEYRANINGINIVFGAVLGFVLAGAEGLPPSDFASLLFTSAVLVVMILYLSSTEYILFYGTATALGIAFLPRLLEAMSIQTDVPQLQPALAVWAMMVVIVELLPRKRENAVKKEISE